MTTRVHIRVKAFGFNHGTPKPGTPEEMRVLCGATGFDPGATALSFPAAVQRVAKVPVSDCCVDCINQLGADPTQGTVVEGGLLTIEPTSPDSVTDGMQTAGAGDVGVLLDNEEMNRLYEAEESVSIKAIVQSLPADGRVVRKFPAFVAQGTTYGPVEIDGRDDLISLRTGQVVTLKLRVST